CGLTKLVFPVATPSTYMRLYIQLIVRILYQEKGLFPFYELAGTAALAAERFGEASQNHLRLKKFLLP
ncbi:MAG: hypothetical protein WCO85_09380, partial [Actinomycetes bacterium]